MLFCGWRISGQKELARATHQTSILAAPCDLRMSAMALTVAVVESSVSMPWRDRLDDCERAALLRVLRVCTDRCASGSG
jgi:hypothetical protein